MAELTLQQLQEQIDLLNQELSEFRLNNEVDHGSIIDQLDTISASSLSSSDLDTIKGNVKKNSEDISTIKGNLINIDTNTNDIKILEQELEKIQKDLSNENLPNIKSRLTELSSRIEAVKANWISKRSFDEYATEVDNKINERAKESDVKVLQNKVGELERRAKVDVTSEIDNIQKNLRNINESIGAITQNVNSNSISISSHKKYFDNLIVSIQKDITEIEARCTDIETNANKTDRKIVDINKHLSDVNCDINELRLKFSGLVNKLNEVKHIINNTIDDLEAKHNRDIQNVITSTDNKILYAIKDHNRYNAAHNREFNELRARLSLIDDRKTGRLKEIDDKASKEWIKILSPEEYRRIPASSIKQDQLYMCIKYGKPYALYIGSVLIAQRNTTKDSGFIYSFPISF